MKRGCYFLIVLLLFAPFDNTRATIPVLSISLVPDDDDEYLPAKREQGADRLGAGQAVALDCLLADNRDHFAGDGRATLPCASVLAGRIDPSLLYVFMSMQC